MVRISRQDAGRFTVDGVDFVRVIQGNKAKMQITGQGGTGEHTIELTDPAGCFAPKTPFCN